MGSCNGLVCIFRAGYYEDIIVWNPCTGISREVPNPSCPLGSCYRSYGFGYDSLSKDFKIILAVEEHPDDSQSCFYYVEVFSLKRNSWKRIRYAVNPRDSIVGEPSYSMRGTHINGVLYWNINDVLHAFDLELETFSIMPLPKTSDGYIGALDNCLSFTDSAFTDSTDIWTLKRCGGVNSWVKFISLTTKDDIRPLYTEDLSSQRIIAKRFVEDQFEDIVAIAVPSGRISRVFEIGEGRSMCDAIAYVEDLVSPTALISEIEGVNTETRAVQYDGNNEAGCQSQKNS
ncbi:F-box/kelch-repeat protein At3g06240-like isoform X2 [Mercurialis annua]|uniref:F-box/kelch-repeat protein At3g06240-like isoform X2 n=1 Tax=Mercurialis annua TaxID=3986 RepID=UPI00215E081B|nr:F-box/kelch-repeat protein At3g06240-like isoform X2 [Mercurialis annua]